jgi:lambda family phage minor tail protein L
VTIASDVQKLTPGNLVTLYQIDTTMIGGTDIFYFTKAGRPGTTLTFDGDVYQPVDMEASGFGYDGSGAFPAPKIRVANMAGALTTIIMTLNDLIGAKLTRIRTFEQYLDDGATPDPGQTFPLDIFTVEQKTAHNKVFIEWRLSSVIEQTDRLLPGRVMLRNYCPFNYRQWVSGTTFIDTNTVNGHIKCPYTGTNYFTESDVPTTAANDKCGKTLNSCTLRFGARNEVKFGGFPGVGLNKGG